MLRRLRIVRVLPPRNRRLIDFFQAMFVSFVGVFQLLYTRRPTLNAAASPEAMLVGFDQVWYGFDICQE